jgi:hypothetical protein
VGVAEHLVCQRGTHGPDRHGEGIAADAQGRTSAHMNPVYGPNRRPGRTARLRS